MMATKLRNFAPLTDLSLEELVPKDNFYCHLQETLDLSFVRDVVEDRYAPSGRPSVDPVVFFKLQLVLFFERLRSERQLMEVVADRLSIRWYLGYDLHEPLPDHSSLTRIRERYGLERSLGCSSSGSWRSASRRGLCGGRSSSSTRRPWRPTPPPTAWSRASRLRSISTTSSRTNLRAPTWHRAKKPRSPHVPRTPPCPRRPTRVFWLRMPNGEIGSPRAAARTGPSSGAAITEKATMS